MAKTPGRGNCVEIDAYGAFKGRLFEIRMRVYGSSSKIGDTGQISHRVPDDD
jgi:hypothetical protein